MIPGHMRQRKGGSLEELGGEEVEETQVKKLVKQLDFNPKVAQKAEKSSSKGGLVSLITLCITFWLIYSEYQAFFEKKTHDVLIVDTEREKPDELLKVYLEIEFPQLPCAVLSLDAVDGQGEQQAFAKAHVVRSRMQNEKDFGHLGQDVLGSEAITSSKWVPPQGYCGSCYDVGKYLANKNRCCNTCLDLKRAYIEHRLDPRIASNSEQCLREAKAPKLVTPNEGCKVHGHLEIQPSKGNFHVAAGRGIQAQHMSHHHHIHQMTARDLETFNISHSIKMLSFERPLPYQKYPLQGVSHIDHQLTQVKYFIQVVPMEIKKGEDDTTGTQAYVYSATAFTEVVDVTQQPFPVPGVFFYYDFSALQIQSTILEPSIIQFITRVCALCGGMFVVLGMVYRFLDHFLTSVLGFEEEQVSSYL